MFQPTELNIMSGSKRWDWGTSVPAAYLQNPCTTTQVLVSHLLCSLFLQSIIPHSGYQINKAGCISTGSVFINCELS